jgi:hypothetical protein
LPEIYIFGQVIRLNLLEGYRIMFNFLDTYFWKNQSDELRDILSSMALSRSDNCPMDIAYEDDWKEAVNQTIGTIVSSSDELSSEAIYKSMVTFLRNWATIGTDGTIENLWKDLDKSNADSDEWQKAIQAVINKKDNPYSGL